MRKNSSIHDPVITKKIFDIRQDSLKKIKHFKDIDKPVSFWIKPDRLISEIGKEITIILRTKGCSWCLGEKGGCSMCGYIKDANIKTLEQIHVKNQFDYVLESKINEISQDDENYSLKIFNSGSFFDESEITEDIRKYIYEKIVDIENIKEFSIESRLEYINAEKLRTLKENLKGKYIELAFGLETVNDYIRKHYINKGMRFEEFEEVLPVCREIGIGVKAYLLLKPPFLNESGAIDDCIKSIRKLIDLKINSISINPLNIQRGTLVEYLWFQNKYRPPWFHSLFKVLRKSINQEALSNIRILSDPSGAGTKRGIHNCLKRECEKSALLKLKNFTLSQDMALLESNGYECDCKKKYQLQKNFY
ncbi:MAG: archaeosine biosynthesis radical SAM protein RaSEA [Candidatus Thorarchaeota archaeon]